MEIVPKKYTILFLAAVVLVLMGIMASLLIPIPKSKPQQPTQYEQELNQIQTQSTSDETTAIEKDLNETDLSDLDKELQDIDKELNQSY